MYYFMQSYPLFFSFSCYFDLEGGSNPIKGDMLVIGGSMLYAISNVSEVRYYVS